MDDDSPEAQEERARSRLQHAVGTDYRVGRLIGRGGFAEVFEATDTRLARRVAIKAVRSDLVVSATLLERFEREARAVAALRHPNVMEIYAVGESGGVAYFVMPFLPGGSLKERLDRDGPMAIEDARRVLLDAAAALEAAHRAGTVHRDVKPDNIMLEEDGSRAVMADFGIARALEGEESMLTGSGVFLGTPQYMSPEQATGDPVDHRTDIYSLGVVAFQMIAGRPPFKAHSLQALVAKHLTEAPPPLWSVRKECPELLGRVVERCLAKDPGRRWSSCRELIDVLEERTPLPALPALDDGPVRTGWGADRAPEQDEAAVVRAFRRKSVIVFACVVGVMVVDAVMGLDGFSLWVLVAAAGWMMAGAGRLWNDGFEWAEIVRGPAAREGLPSTTGGETGEGGLTVSREEDYGRHGSLVKECTAHRAMVLRALAGMSHAEEKRLPDLRETVELLLARLKHVARKVGALEGRIAETAERLERSRARGPGEDPDLASASLSRQDARLQELNGARSEAAEQLRTCVGVFRDLREILSAQGDLDPAASAGEVVLWQRRARAHLSGEAS